MNKTATEPKSATDTPPTNEPVETSTTTEESNFAQQANEAPPGLVAEFVDFLLHNKKWWLTPIILVMLLLGIFAFMTGGPAAPFIYSLF